MPTTRDRLLDAALDAFSSRGVEGTAITDLEAAAGLAPGSGGFYRYFRTKEAVLAAAVDRELLRIEAAGRHPEPPAGLSPRESFARLVVLSLETLDAHAQLIAILAREQGRIPDLAARVQANLVQAGPAHGADMLAAMSPGQGGDEERLRRAGAVTMSALLGYHLVNQYFSESPGALDREGFAAALAEVLVPDA